MPPDSHDEYGLRPRRGLLWRSSEQSGQGVSKTGGDHDQPADGDDEDLLTEEEAAALVRVSLSAVRRLRSTGSGPPHVGIGRQTRYRQAVVQGWWLAGESQRSPADNR